ncbi:MAG: hypothetical protein AMDU1_APLC00027G0004 [Thermoplasmatales archaeon A-plasma]|jgi:hypothetical protein|nr:MAG: hypothetical protein AMDU1_APLC00027G0004 [Thermoplasmatales archaeon A-plasma]
MGKREMMFFEGVSIGELRVQKSVFGSKKPKKVKITLEWE